MSDDEKILRDACAAALKACGELMGVHRARKILQDAAAAVASKRDEAGDKVRADLLRRYSK